jgi:hypothetical protein
MKRKYILILFTIVIWLKIDAQINLTIKKINVYNINVPISKYFIREGDDEGPVVNLNFVFKNNTDSIIKLHPSKSEMIISFQYKNRYNSLNGYPLAFMDNDSLIILPHQQYENSVAVNIFLGTRILKEKNNDYRMELIETLPTLKLFYKEKKIRIKSSEILDVEVMDKKTEILKIKK